MISKSRTCTVSKPRQTRGGVRPPHNRNFDSTHVDHHAPTVSPPQGGRAGDRGSRGGGAPRGSAPLATGLRRALLPFFFRRSPSPRSRDREILLAQRNRNRSLAVGSCRDRAATEANHRHVGSIVGDAGGRRRRSAAVNATSVVVSSFRSGSVAASATLSLFFFPLPPSLPPVLPREKLLLLPSHVPYCCTTTLQACGVRLVHVSPSETRTRGYATPSCCVSFMRVFSRRSGGTGGEGERSRRRRESREDATRSVEKDGTIADEGEEERKEGREKNGSSVAFDF